MHNNKTVLDKTKPFSCLINKGNHPDKKGEEMLSESRSILVGAKGICRKFREIIVSGRAKVVIAQF